MQRLLRLAGHPGRRRLIGLALLAALLLALLFGLRSLGAADPQRSAGAMTVNNRTSASFEQPAGGLSARELATHAEADLLFDRVHVPLPGQDGAGLGPQFVANSCIACHVRNGRGRAVPEEALVRLALRQGEGRQPLPDLGGQLQDKAVLGAQPEATLRISWQPATLPDAQPGANNQPLRLPQLDLEVGQGDLSPARVARSLRLAPPLLGMGLLEAVPERQILALADPDDADGDGISGRAHWLIEADGQRRLGRFGWKAITPDVRAQSAAAYLEDMGLTTPVDTTSERAADGRPADIGNRELDLVAYYSRTLGAPRTARPAGSAVVQRGQHLFQELHCARCHVPQLHTGNDPGAVVAALRQQRIWPYTDLLLHDMGPGLDDGVAERGAASREWRTAPLWGIGLTQKLNSQATFLHDGRARNLEEAILWHGGEAAGSRDCYLALAPGQRRALLRWLQQL